MKAIFSLLGLVLVLAIVGSLAKKQLQALGSGATTRSAQAASAAGLPAVPGALAADPNAATLPQVSRGLQEQARDRTADALRQGMQRNERADR